MNSEALIRIGQSVHEHLERLAADGRHTIEAVERLYLTELVALERQARIHAFVPLIAMRRVRDALRAS